MAEVPLDTERRRVTRPDGRHIDFLVAGPADGLPLMLHEGTPAGLVLYPPTVQAARIRGLRVVLAARPGYEGSTPRPGRRVVDVVGDTAAVLDELGADTFVTAGWSGGGPLPARPDDHRGPRPGPQVRHPVRITAADQADDLGSGDGMREHARIHH